MRIAERRLCSAIDDSRRRPWSTVAGRRLSAWRTPAISSDSRELTGSL